MMPTDTIPSRTSRYQTPGHLETIFESILQDEHFANNVANPNTTDRVESLQTSYWTPRQIQFSARITF
jgi:hypothetical protein